jgi:hypothetical protein
MVPSPLRRNQSRVPLCDRRSADHRLMRRVRDDLTRHVGGNPSATQFALIHRCAWLTLYLARLDENAMASGGVHDDRAAREYLSYNNALTRAVARLGLQSASLPKQTHTEWLASLTPPPNDRMVST